jgi:hypothetical protein
MRTVWKLNGRYGLRDSAAADYRVHDLHEILSLPLLGDRAHEATVSESPMPHDDDNEDRY